MEKSLADNTYDHLSYYCFLLLLAEHLVLKKKNLKGTVKQFWKYTYLPSWPEVDDKIEAKDALEQKMMDKRSAA